MNLGKHIHFSRSIESTEAILSRIAIGAAAVSADPMWGCFPYWATMDAIASHHAPMDLLYFEGDGANRVMYFPSANATLHRESYSKSTRLYTQG